MSKKSKRNRAKQRNPDTRIKSQVGLATGQMPGHTLTESKVTAASPESSKYAALSKQYQYVLPELKIISLIAGILFLILIVLSFVLG
jgi:hypothetical protein